ncbi:Putative membrane protein [Gloeomargarita lithophora Alchichica-D10]|uniref:Membrane protein n=2 Tax=Gloeomargarita TaxID=1188227 RepID=A0A1J0AC91_9CYAN|nr:Putative membrane protein [Gloeomargarita lithophora Alchichica-D10]
MVKRFLAQILCVLALVSILTLGGVSPAWAARTGGRISGGSFRRPTSSYRLPSRSANPSYNRGYYGGGGIGFPLFTPFFFGGGGLFSVVLLLGVAGFIVQAVQRFQEQRQEQALLNPTVTVAQMQVALLAQARSLQKELDQLAKTSTTDTGRGRVQLVQGLTLALLRHPEYWSYAYTSTEKVPLNQAETEFNRLALRVRAQVQQETLVNATVQTPSVNLTDAEPGEYLLVTLLVASTTPVKLPVIQTLTDVKNALTTLGSVGADALLALEILWSPQAQGDTLSQEELVTAHPLLRPV